MHLVIADAWGDDRGSSPFPPIYSAGPLTWETPLFLTPTVLLSLVTFAGFVRCFSTYNDPWVEADGRRRRRLSPLSRLAVAVSITIQLTFVAEAVVFAARAILDKHWTSTVLAYYIGVSWLAWLVSLVWVADEAHKYGRWNWVQYVFWLAASVGESLVGYLWLIGFLRPRAGTIYSIYDFCFLGIFLTRYALELSTLGLCVIQMFAREDLAESAPLVTGAGPQTSYGAAHPVPASPPKPRNGFWTTVRRLLPYVWPRKSFWLQSGVFLCLVLILAGLAVNACTPLLLGRLVNIFAQGPGTFVWVVVLIYVGLKFLQGGSGFIQSLQNWLWIPIGQYVTREISVRLFSHLQLLSLQSQVSQKTGEALRAMDRGTTSVSQLLSQGLFQVFPALANIAVAVALLWFLYSPTFGLIVLLTMSLYILVTIWLTEWRVTYNRTMIQFSNEARAIAVDSLLNIETVRYYGAEDFESDRYQKAIAEHQLVERRSLMSQNLLNLAQNTVITGGILAGCLLLAWDVSRGRLTAGDFVTFNIYMLQLYLPLHAFGTYYLAFQSHLSDVDRMLALFDQEKIVKDRPDATELERKEGLIVFDKVSFSYGTRQKVLDNISFSIPKGANVALVGPPGGGKATIFRLLFRFFDPDEGHIYIDGQDIQHVTQRSLRQQLGVVPQEPVLFNDTVLYNVAYGSSQASQDAIFRAAKAANIHNKIVTYPRGYETRVRDRGFHLSDSEKQRIAIARTILKNPSIVLVDEASRGQDTRLDDISELHVQQALSTLTDNRTTVVIARRLSTIINADLILVVKDGQVVESGTHDDLIRQAVSRGGQGVYYETWRELQLYEGSEDTVPSPKKTDDRVVIGPVDVDVAPLPLPILTHSPNQAASNDTDAGPSGL